MRAPASPGPDVGDDGLQGGDDVGQETGGIAIALVQRQPGHARLRIAAIALGDPFAQQRGLAEAGGRRDQRQLATGGLVSPQALVQARNESRSWDGFSARRGE